MKIKYAKELMGWKLNSLTIWDALGLHKRKKEKKKVS